MSSSQTHLFSTTPVLVQPSPELTLLPSSQPSSGDMWIPSLKWVTQICAGGEEGLLEQYHPLIEPEHKSLHPLLSVLSPSSQTSGPTFKPSPHIGSHIVAVIAALLIQLQPGSNWQVELHPSRLTVFPSSHCSFAVINPSPHCSIQISGCERFPPLQCHPSISPEQSALQPCPSVLSPSSQGSPATLMPSPQKGPHTLAVMPALFTQDHPASTWQVELHPSRLTVPPSSHCSPGVMKPSPHCSLHVSFVVADPPVQCHPFNSPDQSDLHPMPSRLFPSSHASPATL